MMILKLFCVYVILVVLESLMIGLTRKQIWIYYVLDGLSIPIFFPFSVISPDFNVRLVPCLVFNKWKKNKKNLCNRRTWNVDKLPQENPKQWYWVGWSLWIFIIIQILKMLNHRWFNPFNNSATQFMIHNFSNTKFRDAVKYTL